MLWETGPSPMGAIHDALSSHNDVVYTTTQKMVQVMRDKGLVVVDASVRPPRYSAADPPERTKLKLLDYLAQRAFGGSAKELVMSLVSNKRLSPKELDEIRGLLASKKRKS